MSESNASEINCQVKLGPEYAQPFDFWYSSHFFATPATRSTAASFDDLVLRLYSEKRPYREKKKAPLLFQGAFVEGATTKGYVDIDFQRLPPFVFVDLDGVTGTLADVYHKVATSLPGVKFACWQTFSYGTKGIAKSRLLFVLTDRPKALDETALAWRGVQHLLSHLGPDMSCSDVTRGQTFPCCDAKQYSDVLFYYQSNGLAIDKDWLVSYARKHGFEFQAPKAVKVLSDDYKDMGGDRVFDRPGLLSALNTLDRRIFRDPANANLGHARAFLDAVNQGKAWGNADNRNIRAVQGLYTIASIYPDISPKSVAVLCKRSLAAMMAQSDRTAGSTVYDENYIVTTLCAKALPQVNARMRELAEQDAKAEAEAREFAAAASEESK